MSFILDCKFITAVKGQKKFQRSPDGTTLEAKNPIGH
jgi:hypothetical protein